VDIKISNKEKRTYSDGVAEVLLSNACDLYPIFGDNPIYNDQNIIVNQRLITNEARKNVIMDIEILNNDKIEQLDRATFAVMKQRGADPLELRDGIQWAELILGEIPYFIGLSQVQKAVAEEGTGVRSTMYTTKKGSKESLIVRIDPV
jgi:hypothetical protein